MKYSVYITKKKLNTEKCSEKETHVNLHQNVYIFGEYQTLKKKKFKIQRITTIFVGSTTDIICVIICAIIDYVSREVLSQTHE